MSNVSELNIAIAEMLGYNVKKLTDDIGTYLYRIEPLDGPHTIIGGHRFIAYGDDCVWRDYWGDTIPNWSNVLRCAWHLMEELNYPGSPIVWSVFREKLMYVYGVPIGLPEKDFCENICRAILDARREVGDNTGR